MGCDCGKQKPGPHGGQKPAPGQSSLVASVGSSSGSVTHVAPNGSRTPGLDLIAARAAVARQGGSIDLG